MKEERYHLTEGEINQDGGGTSKPQRKMKQLTRGEKSGERATQTISTTTQDTIACAFTQGWALRLRL